jgi:hypothetical protein
MLFTGGIQTSPDFYPSRQMEKTKSNRDRCKSFSARRPNREILTGSQTKGRNRQCSGLRGGNWNNNADNERVSNRNNAANTNTNRNNNYGFRAGNTCIENNGTKKKMSFFGNTK